MGRGGVSVSLGAARVLTRSESLASRFILIGPGRGVGLGLASGDTLKGPKLSSSGGDCDDVKAEN